MTADEEDFAKSISVELHVVEEWPDNFTHSVIADELADKLVIVQGFRGRWRSQDHWRSQNISDKRRSCRRFSVTL